MIHYLPGCDTRRNHLKASDKVIAYLKNKGVQVEKCCKTKDQIADSSEILIHNCTMCELILGETCPDVHLMSLYEFLLQQDEDHHGRGLPFRTACGQGMILCFIIR